MKITFFGTQPYDRESFDRANERYGFEFNYHRSHLNGNNTSLAQPRIISTGIIRLTAANEVLPTKLETNKPSTTPYIDVNISITIDGIVNLMSFLYPK